MKTRKADTIIASGQPATVHNPFYNETFTAVFVGRDRFNIHSEKGGVFDRKDLEIIEWPSSRPVNA